MTPLRRMQTRETQAGSLLQAQHAIHRLHAVACASLYQIIKSAHHHHTTAMRVSLKAHITEICTTENLGLWIPIHPLALFHHTHKGFLLVCFPVYAPHLSITHRVLQEHMRRREHAAHHL